MLNATDADVARMRNQLFFEPPDVRRKLSSFWLLLVLAAVIASAGVIADSTATVIGAMIVAPLMTPILGTVLGVVLADHVNLLRSVGLVVSGALAVIVVGFMSGLLVSTSIVAATNSQVSGRVTPTLVDLVAALATGVVGAVALTRDDIADTLPGVAIAISLVPPLVVVGLTLESGATTQAFGALLLFLTNVSAILASGLVVMAAYRVSRHATAAPAIAGVEMRPRRAVAVIIASLVVIAIPLTYSSLRIAHTRSTEATINDAATRWADPSGWEVLDVASRQDQFVVRATGPLPEPDTTKLRDALVAAGVGDERVTVQLLPSHVVTYGTGH